MVVLKIYHQGGVTLVNIIALLETEGKFFRNPKDINALEKSTKATTYAVAAFVDFSNVLSSMDEKDS